jgi:hypothetical protein
MMKMTFGKPGFAPQMENDVNKATRVRMVLRIMGFKG